MMKLEQYTWNNVYSGEITKLHAQEAANATTWRGRCVHQILSATRAFSVLEFLVAKVALFVQNLIWPPLSQPKTMTPRQVCELAELFNKTATDVGAERMKGLQIFLQLGLGCGTDSMGRKWIGPVNGKVILEKEGEVHTIAFHKACSLKKISALLRNSLR